MALASWTQQQIISQLDSGDHWSGSTITYSFPTSSSGIYGSQEAAGFRTLNITQQSFVEIALQAWDDLIAPDLLRTSSASNIEFGMTNTGIDYAHSYTPTTGSVWFNRSYSELLSPQVGQHSFMTYVHEIGHAFGLDHMGNYNGNGNWAPSSYQDSGVYSIMSYFGPNWGSGQANGEGLVAWADWVGADGRLYAPQTPMLNDVMAMQAIYGLETATRTGDTVYGFGSNVTGSLSAIYNFTVNLNPILTIFDSGGNDTLNLGGWSTSCTVDLAPGGYSSCDSMTYNIAIAYASDIENAIGGGGNDTISGNALNNRLDGGAGSDTISGGGGDDILVVGQGNDVLDGGAGFDSVVFAGIWSSYTFSYSDAQGYSFFSIDTGSDVIRGVESFVFSDVTKSASELLGVQSVPVVSIAAGAASKAEGNSGSTLFTFNVSLGGASGSEQTVNWVLAGSGVSAASTTDFTCATSGVITFLAGETSKTIEISVAGDTLLETDEEFSVTLSNPSSGLVLGTSTANCSILNDDVVSNVDDYPLSTETSGVVTIDGPAQYGAIETMYDSDFFKVSLVAGLTYVFDLTQTGGSLDPYLELYNANLQGVAVNDDANASTLNSQITYTATTTGTYYLVAWDYLSATGNYTISATTRAGMTLTGTASANTLNGSTGNDELYGLGGNDTLKGSGGDDLLDGGTGADKLEGGAGDDVYLVDNTADVVTEISAGGVDRVQSSVSFTLAANVENLTLSGNANVMGTGNALANVITGNGGNNVLVGRGGIDTLNGGLGSDIFLFENGTDHLAAEIVDSGSSGTDEVRFAATSAGTLTLYAGDTGVERIVIGTGTGVTAATGGATALNVNASAVLNGLTMSGNAGANTLTGTAFNDLMDGGAGNDVLVGGDGSDKLIGRAGNDRLTGGGGADTFVFNAALNAASNKDTLTDFQPGFDTIQLSRAIFTALGSATGSLTASRFWSGAGVVKGHDADDRIVYNTATGALYYDADGSGRGAAVQICLLGTGTQPTIANSDFQIIA